MQAALGPYVAVLRRTGCATGLQAILQDLPDRASSHPCGLLEHRAVVPGRTPPPTVLCMHPLSLPGPPCPACWADRSLVPAGKRAGQSLGGANWHWAGLAGQWVTGRTGGLVGRVDTASSRCTLCHHVHDAMDLPQLYAIAEAHRNNRLQLRIPAQS